MDATRLREMGAQPKSVVNESNARTVREYPGSQLR